MITAVLSGKGGTGKTFVSVNLAYAAGTCTYIDCDVEEPNGHIFFKPEVYEKKAVDVKIPSIDPTKCNGCRICVNFCKFNALAYIKDHVEVFEDICHSCGGCSLLCPTGAISEVKKNIGTTKTGLSGKVTVLSGILNTGEESGVPIIKELLNKIDNSNRIFIDSPPGSSCSVMESIRDADYCILVTEPTVFGLHNLRMVVELVKIFNKPHGVVINKTTGPFHILEEYLKNNNIKVLMEIPYQNDLGDLNSRGHVAAMESPEYKVLFTDLLKIVEKEPHMYKLLVLSGKGGTGKTTVSSALIKLSNINAFADCDVDAPNLHLAIDHIPLQERSDFKGMQKAKIDHALCIDCGICMNNCRFDAIKHEAMYEVDFFSCEGCAVCYATCPTDAISMEEAIAGKLDLYMDEKIFSTAKLNMGFGNSGLLVSEVKKNLDNNASQFKIAIIDGSPGLGCPVIASISGVDMLLLVTEPTLSGISDMERIIETARGFFVEIAVCINKEDINLDNTRLIEKKCEVLGIPVVGKVPYDPSVSDALNSGINITDIDCPASAKLKELYYNTFGLINERIKENKQ